MNYLDLVLANDDRFKFVEVSFAEFDKPSKTYTYKSNIELVESDLVVVPIGQLDQNIFKTARVIKVMDPFDCDFSFNTKWIAGLVDLTKYVDTLKYEAEARVIVNKAKAKKAMAEALEEIKLKLDSDELSKLDDLSSKI